MVSYWGLAILVLVAAVSQAHADYCCSFDNDNLCDWFSIPNGPNVNDNYEWAWSGEATPPVIYDDFEDHVGYLWLEDLQLRGYANASVRSPSTTLYHNDHISIEVYRHITFYDGGSRPVLYFVDADTLTYNALYMEWNPGWEVKVFQCGDATICCDHYPCNGFFEVVGILYDKPELLAFDNLQVNGLCTKATTTTTPTTTTTTPTTTTTTPTTTTTTPTTTTIPPPPPTCCHFDDASLCNWDLEAGLGWDWSSNAKPKTSVSHSTSYLWTENVEKAVLYSSKQYYVQNITNFGFEFYGETSGSSYVSVSLTTATSTRELYTGLADTGLKWVYYSIPCDKSDATSCCETYPCDGELTFTAHYDAVGDAVFAVDDVEANGGCGNPQCCTFSAPDFCGWVNTDNSDPWKWSGNVQPIKDSIPEFKPQSGEYAWLQKVGTGPEPTGTDVLQSPIIPSVDDSFYFDISYYVDIRLISTNSLYVYFHEEGKSTKVLLTALYSTNNNWLTQQFYCNSPTTPNGCCQAGLGSTCTGYLELDGSLSSGEVFYAIDDLAINGRCI